MFWQRKMWEYDILIPPLKKSFEEMSKQEADLYFTWFMEQIPHRINYLSQFCARQLGIDQGKLDLSPDSLVFIWKWFLSIAEVERTPRKKIDYLATKYTEYPYVFKEYLLNQQKEQFSLQTEYILMDIGIYIGEVFIKANSRIHWGYYSTPKTDFFVNRPVLLGFFDDRFTPPFPTEFEPVHMVGVQAANIWDKTQLDTDLLNLYNKWTRFIPQSI